MKEKYEENFPYDFTLEPLYRDFAQKHLHESENIRSQALTQLREWIDKDPAIKRCRRDPIFLLRFLRFKKFNVEASYLAIKKYLSAFQLYSKWLSNMNVDEGPLIQLLSSGMIIPLPERDELGRQIIVYRFGVIDPDVHTAKDVYRLQTLTYHILFEDEETQIAGYSFLVDFSGFSMRHVSMFSLLDFKNLATAVHHIAAIRICKADILNMSRLLQPFYEICMAMMSSKLRRRMKLFNSVEDFKKSNTIAVRDAYPKEYGGKKEAKVLSGEFMKKMMSRRDLIARVNDMYMEIPDHMKSEWYQHDKSSKIDTGMVGSFRQLALD